MNQNLVRRFYCNVASKSYDAVVIGAGHNGLVAAAYLQRNGFKVCVLEKRGVIGGAAVTEEIVPGFKFSRASYVLSLLRPYIYRDLKLKEFGLKVYQRDPFSYTPLLPEYYPNATARSLTLWADMSNNIDEIKKFSKKDVKPYILYNQTMECIAQALDPLMDIAPRSFVEFLDSSSSKKILTLLRDRDIRKCFKSVAELGMRSDRLLMFLQLMTSSPLKILSEWFENDVLKATLATDALIGTVNSPSSFGTGYVLLLHSVMGECEGERGRWGYPEGGMGAVSNAIANSAKALGVHIHTDKTVHEIAVEGQKAVGVILDNGDFIPARIVLSNATSKITFLDLLPSNTIDEDFLKSIGRIDYKSATTKINVALKRIPNFVADPCPANANKPSFIHQATIHLNNESIDKLNKGFEDFQNGICSSRPLIEMTLPSVLDPTIAPPGCHVCNLFTQYTPNNASWDKEEYATRVFSQIDEYAPGFSDAIVDYEILAPDDLEQIFGLTGGNIFHGAMNTDNIFFSRPWDPKISQLTGPNTPIDGLFLCGSGAHPGGGVSGAPGYIASIYASKYLRQKNVKEM